MTRDDDMFLLACFFSFLFTWQHYNPPGVLKCLKINMQSDTDCFQGFIRVIWHRVTGSELVTQSIGTLIHDLLPVSTVLHSLMSFLFNIE